MALAHLKSAIRALTHKPSFIALAVGMLALGVASNATVFALFNGLFLQPLPFPHSERLVDLDETAPKWNMPFVGVSVPDYLHWRENSRTFEGMAFFAAVSATLSGDGAAERLNGAAVASDLLKVFQLKPVLGRSFLADEDRPDAPKVIMLAHSLWRARYGGRTDIVGSVVRLDGQSFTVVGVLPPEAAFPSSFDYWVPLGTDPRFKAARFTGWFLNGIGRLKPGVTLAQARSELFSVHRAEPAGRVSVDVTSPTVMPLRDRYVGSLWNSGRILLAAVGLLLLIACTNVAGLTLVRATQRSRDMAVRIALGAARRQLVAQLLTESLLLAAAGGVMGILLGSICLSGMAQLLPHFMPSWITLRMDYRFALFVVGLTGLAAILCGLWPALCASRTDVSGSLHQASRSSLSRSRRRGLDLLVAAEIALAVPLLVAAGLVVQTLHRVMQVDPGFRVQGMLSYSVPLPWAKYDTPARVHAFQSLLLEKLRAMPGVRSVALASLAPLGGENTYMFVAEGGRQFGPGEQQPLVLHLEVSDGYFDALGTQILEGRPIDERDGAGGRRVAVVNEAFARRFWPDGKALGRRVRISFQQEWREVVGVARDMRQSGLDREVRPAVFLPATQEQAEMNNFAVVLHATVDPGSLIEPSRRVLRELDPELPLFNAQTLTRTMDAALWMRRAFAWLIGGFGAMAVIMAAGGIYGVISYAVSQRTREIGIRMAFGARRQHIFGEVLGQGLRLVGAGLSAGLLLTMWATDLLQSVLFGIGPRDVPTHIWVILGIALVGVLANLVPASRAAAISPIDALRSE